MAQYIGVYKKSDKDVIMWISINSQLGMFLKETYNIPQLNTITFNQEKLDYEVAEDENYLVLEDVDTALKEMELHLIRSEREALLKLLFDPDNKEALLEDYRMITEDHQTLGQLYLLSTICFYNDSIMLAVS